MNRLRAVLLAVATFVLLVLATPGIDSLGLDRISQKDREAALEDGVPEVVLSGLSVFGAVRRPLLRLFTPLEHPLRIEQSWGLYGSGPERVRRMEILLDEELVYRTEDSEHDWREPMFRNRRLRPMVDTVSRKPDAENRDALMWLISDRAAADHSDLSRVEVRFTVAKFPGSDARVAHAFEMLPPHWTPERL
ncbi:MAG: hypothetical protein ACI8RZ_001192 [Myxococcota bacterium]